MTLQAIQGALYWPPIIQSSGPGSQSLGGLIMDVAGERCATVLRVPKSGTISRVGFRTKSVTSGPHTLDVRLETVDASGNPSGTLVATGVSATKSVSAAGTWYDVALGTAWTEANGCVKGSVIAIVLRVATSGTPDVDISVYTDDNGREFPYSLTYQSSAWSKSKGGMVAALEYSDATYEWSPGLWPIVSAASASVINSSLTINRIGNRFKLPFPCTVDGCWLWVDKDQPLTVKLLNDADAPTATPLAEVTAADGPGDSDFRTGTSGGLEVWMFDAAVDLAKDTWYRLVLEPESTSNISFYEMGVDTTVGVKLMDALPAGQNCYKTSWEKVTPVWVETTTSRVQMGLMISKLDDGAGGGGGGGSINRGILTGGRL